MEPTLRTSGLTKNYGDLAALADLNLSVSAGEVFGFLGPNGAGKTTAIRLLMNEIGATSGTAWILGLDVHRDSVALRHRIGYLPSELELYPNMTGADLIHFFANLRGGVDARYVEQLGERLNAQMSKKIGDLSSGNRQKIGIIQAFMNKPEFVILDEPSAGLDPLVQRELQGLIRETADQGGTVFLSSHTLSEVQRVADRVGIIRSGKLIALETIASLRGKGIRKIEIELASEPEESVFEGITGIRSLLIERNRVFISYEGTMEKLLSAVMSKCDLLDVSTNEADLEEVFLTYYHDESV
ncbi:MAG: ABC transporter ATP-binding protein [Candidatus Nanopelagicales bacterium]|jgi:ABC-2 type transport system ATP-binding protein|nr:ABC transporter ATP-binding protein [Candidatus Nanopelagicales bacterium]